MATNIPAQDHLWNEFLFSCNKANIPVAAVYDFLAHRSYWAKGISLETVACSIEHSICIGIYDSDGALAGFGRMITDRATFAYLADIFVIESYRGKGLSKELMRLFCGLAEDFGLRRFILTTQDAHSLYAQFGFEPFPWPERIMSRQGVSYLS